MEVSHVAVVAPQETMEAPPALSVAVSTYRDVQDLLGKLVGTHLSELHLTIDEAIPEDPVNLARLYEAFGHCRLDRHPLRALSITYKCRNQSDANNCARYMIILKLLRSLNWDICSKVDVNLYINYVSEDVRVQSLQDLPINLTVSGTVGCEDELDYDSQKLDAITKVYPYLEGCF